MLAWQFVTPVNSAEIVDLLIFEDLNSFQVVRIKAGKSSIPVISKPDLIKMKLASGRPQDLEDIKALEGIK